MTTAGEEVEAARRIDLVAIDEVIEWSERRRLACAENSAMEHNVPRYAGLTKILRAYLALLQGQAAAREEVRAALQAHWLAGIFCDHEAKTDIATCSCSTLKADPKSSVREAVEVWIDHVLSALSPR